MTPLTKPNRVRTTRARIHAELAGLSSDQSLCMAVDILERDELEPSLNTVAVHDFLVWIKRIGDETARGVLRELLIGERRELAELTQRQRFALASALRARVSSWSVADSGRTDA